MKKLNIAIVGIYVAVFGNVVHYAAMPALPPLPAAPAQQVAEPYPGQSNHAEPPNDWFCERQNYELNIPQAHVCSCEHGCDAEGVRHEDKKCTVFCHADHCHCPLQHQDLCPVPDPAR